MAGAVSPAIVEAWLKGWSLSRELPLPVKFRSGFKVEVGYEKQKTRYVFPGLNDDLVELSQHIGEPWVFLKTCASPEEVKSRIGEQWVIQPQGYMMSRFGPMHIVKHSLPGEYKLAFDSYNSTFVVSILTQHGELAASGRVVLVDDLAVYDRIITGPHYRRQGLATVLMHELEQIALSKGVFKNFLVATEEGRAMYRSLGWELYSLYTSVVIPGT